MPHRPENPDAFPVPFTRVNDPDLIGGIEYSSEVIGGMSLRDYFAAKALLAICDEYLNQGEEPNVVARDAYRLADAMLAEREKSAS